MLGTLPSSASGISRMLHTAGADRVTTHLWKLHKVQGIKSEPEITKKHKNVIGDLFERQVLRQSGRNVKQEQQPCASFNTAPCLEALTR